MRSDFLTTINETAGRIPHRIAVEADDGRYSFGELDRISNQLAHRLIALGVTRETRVAISIPRGASELLVMLATAKAGGAYVPLDPSHPVDRLRAIVEDAEPLLMLVHPYSPLYTADMAGVQRIAVDDMRSLTDGWPTHAPEQIYDDQQLLYILFTSGSTGRPKGVEVPRGAFTNFLTSMASAPGLVEIDRLLAITTTSFDIAGLELFLPLLVGATVVIADKETTRDPRLLRRKLESADISVLQATPATWRMLLDAGWQGDGKLKMLCGGEALSKDLARRLLAAGSELWNMYGPTETTVWSTIERVETLDGPISIGRPIDETTVYVLDAELRAVEANSEGEICIGGSGLARGYRGKPELTAEKFVVNPNDPAGRVIYRTGDLGRVLPDGRLQCLGRHDHQVKIRGFRVELGEIENVLGAVQDVSEVLVVSVPKSEGDPGLAAYWIGQASREALIAAARSHLPDYMVPTLYIPVERFELNVNGKIDRSKLPSPDQTLSTGSMRVAPRSDTELRIAVIWQQVLGVRDISVEDNFFTIGGTSLRAAQAVALLGNEFGFEIPIRTLFESPTIAELADSLGSAISLDAPIVVELRRGARDKPPLFCLFGVQIYQALAHRISGDVSVYGMHIPMRYRPGVEAPPDLELMAAKYIELIREYQPKGPYHLAGFCFGGVVAYHVAHELQKMGETIAAVTVLDAVLPTAVHIDRHRYFLALAKRLFTQMPRECSKLAGQTSELLRTVVNSHMARLSLARGREPPRPVEFSVISNEADSYIAAFAKTRTMLDASLLVIAAKDELAPWQVVAPHLGWRDRAARTVCHTIYGNHLEILREPLAQLLARHVDDVHGFADCGLGSAEHLETGVRQLVSSDAAAETPLH